MNSRTQKKKKEKSKPFTKTSKSLKKTQRNDSVESKRKGLRRIDTRVPSKKTHIRLLME